MTEPLLLASGLRKRFGEVVAVDGVDLSAHAGTCLGLLGPNGAGKTTTIEMLEGIIQPDAGTVRILGRTWREDPRGIRARIGVQLQETRFQDRLTTREVLRLFHAFYESDRPLAALLEAVGQEPGRSQTPLDGLLDLIGLTEKAEARIGTLSGGQRQRLALGCALVNGPELLFLDEPTTGLDPQARRRFWDIVEALKRAGRCVLLTTHYMDEAERLADHLVIVDRGRVIAEGTPRQIIDRLGAEAIVELTVPDTASLPDFSDIPGVRTHRSLPGGCALEVTNTQSALQGLLGRLASLGIRLDDLRTHRATLEDVFVSLTGKQLRDGR